MMVNRSSRFDTSPHGNNRSGGVTSPLNYRRSSPLSIASNHFSPRRQAEQPIGASSSFYGNLFSANKPDNTTHGGSVGAGHDLNSILYGHSNKYDTDPFQVRSLESRDQSESYSQNHHQLHHSYQDHSSKPYDHHHHNQSNQDDRVRGPVDDDQNVVVGHDLARGVNKSYLLKMKHKYKKKISANVSGTKFEIGKLFLVFIKNLKKVYAIW